MPAAAGRISGQVDRRGVQTNTRRAQCSRLALLWRVLLMRACVSVRARLMSMRVMVIWLDFRVMVFKPHLCGVASFCCEITDEEWPNIYNKVVFFS